VSTPAGRRSVLKLAHRMTSSLCRGIGASRGVAWSKAPNGGSGDVRVMSRKNTGEPGEPQGLISCAVLSTWLPLSPTALLDFLRDETRRHEVSPRLLASLSLFLNSIRCSVVCA
jgi:homeobox-leucine zipper protein